MRKNSARPARSMTSSSWASRLTTGRRERVVAAARARPAQLRQVRERRLAVGHREAREAVLLEPEIDRARRRQLGGGGDPLRPGPSGRRVGGRERARAGRHAASSVARLQVATRRRAGAGRRACRATGRAGSRSGRRPARDPRAGRSGRRWRPRPAARARAARAADSITSQSSSGSRWCDSSTKKPLVAGRIAPPEQRRVARRDRPCPGAIADPQPACQLPVTTARQRDQALRVLGQERLAEAGHALGAGQVRPRHEPAQAPPADLRAGQQDEVRTAGPVPDAAQVLLDRIAMTRKPGTCRAWPGGQTLVDRGRPRTHRLVAGAGAATAWPARPDHDLVRVRDGRDPAARSRDRPPGEARPPGPRSRSGPRRTARHGR